MQAGRLPHEINAFRFDPALTHDEQTLQMRRLSGIRHMLLGIRSNTVYFNRDEGLWVEVTVWDSGRAPHLGISDDAQASAVLERIEQKMPLQKLDDQIGDVGAS